MANQFLIKETMADMKDLSVAEIDGLKGDNRTYAGVQLLGYYERGDTPAPIIYRYVDLQNEPDPGADNGGSIVKFNGVILEHNFNGVVNLLYFGFKDGQDISISYEKALPSVSSGDVIIIPSCNTFTTKPLLLKSGIHIKGQGIRDTIIRSHQLATHIFKSSNITYKNIDDVRLLKKVLTDDNTIFISDTSKVAAGDFIILKSDKIFTREWDGGSTIRDYYTDGELLKILEVYQDRVIIEGKCFLGFDIEGTTMKTFSPVGIGGSIKDLAIVTKKDTGTLSNCLSVEGWENLYLDNIKTENANSNGVGLYTCYKTKLDCIETIGGTANLGLNYGIMIADGTKYTDIQHLVAKKHRHGLAGGGRGLAIPMYCNLENVIVTESQSHSVDCHANTAFFTVKNACVDNFYSMSGIGHRMDHIISSGLTYAAFAYEGGKNLSLGYAYVANAGDCYVERSWVNFDIGYLEINYGSTRDNFSFFSIPSNSKNTTIRTLRVNNTLFDLNKTPLENKLAILNSTKSGVVLRGDTLIDTLEITGMSRGVHVQSANVIINRFVAKNTGWGDTNDVNGTHVLSLSGGGNNFTLNNTLIDNSSLPVEFTVNTFILSFSGGTAVATMNTVIRNLRYAGGSVRAKIVKNNYFNDFKFDNVRFGTVTGSIPTSLGGRFIDCDFIQD
ncbi:hypothetical protein [Sphingobacterium sp. DR205]|uniref:hypothetical protein n=1 Tax=Sphingobacterium sp. DR205 TaxID=2713573 RepID=UPI0013E483EB|nr:hypothetical protein [Sphingobacterium sp. DR205]QIH34803.1 hypothetical protein G6053_18720 [Sphingobacterium sp. DR205]